MTTAKRLLIAIGLNAALVVAEVVGGLVAHSAALVADAGHNLADVAALALALVAFRYSLRRATSSRSFGYHRATILAALGNVAVLLFVTIGVAAEAIWKLHHLTSLRPGIVIVIAAVAAVVDGISALVLIDRSRDLNLKAAMLHLGADAFSSIGITIAALIEFLSGRFFILDPAVSLALALLIAVEAIRIGRDSVNVLLESVPDDVDPNEVAAAIQAVPGVDGVHHLHCWSLSGDVRAMSAHVLVSGHPTLEEAQVVGDRVKSAIGPRFSISHATIELECEPCADDDDFCLIDVPVSASNR